MGSTWKCPELHGMGSTLKRPELHGMGSTLKYPELYRELKGYGFRCECRIGFVVALCVG